MTSDIGFYGGGGGKTLATYQDAGGNTVQVSTDNPLPVTFGGDITLPADLAIDINGQTVKLDAGTVVALAAGTEVALAAGSVVTLDNTQLPLPVDIGSDPVTVTGSVTLAGASTVALAPGTTVGLANGTEIALEAGTTVDLAPGTTVALAAGTSVKVTADSPLPVVFSGTPTVALAGGTTVTVTADTPLPIVGSVALDPTSTVTIDDTTPIDVALTAAVEVVNPDGEALEITGIVDLLGGAEVTLAGTPTVKLDPTSTVKIDDTQPVDVNLIGSGSVTGTVDLADGAEVTLADGSEVTLAPGATVGITGPVDIDDTVPVKVDLVSGGLDGPIEVTNVTGESLDVHLDAPVTISGAVALAPGTTVGVTGEIALDDTTPIDVNIVSGGGGAVTGTVDLAAGTEVALAAGTEIALAAGTEVALAAGTQVGITGLVDIDDTTPLKVDVVSGGLDGPIEVTNVTGESLDVHLDADVTLAAGSTVALAPGTSVDITSGTVALTGPVTIDDTTPIDVNIVSGGGGGGTITGPIEVETAGGTTLDVNVVSAATQTVTGAVTIANTTAERVPVDIDDTTPIDVNIVSGGGGGTITGPVEVTNVTGESLDVNIDGDLTLAAGTEVTLAAGATVAVTSATPLPVAIDGTPTVVIGGTVPVTVDDSTPIDVNIVSGGAGGGGAAGDIITTPDGDAQLVTLAGSPVAVTLAAGTEVTLADGTQVALAAGTSVALAAGSTVEVTNPAGQTLDVTVDGALTLDPATTVALTPGTTVGITGTPTVSVSGDVALAEGSAVYVLADSLAVGAANPMPVTGQVTVDSTTPIDVNIVAGGAGGGASGDTELPAAVALADGAANPTTPTVGSDEHVFNGTTWDRVRSANAGNSTAGIGVPAAGILGYDATNSLYRRVATNSSGMLQTAAPTLTATGSASAVADIIAATDVMGYASLSIQIGNPSTANAVTVLGSNDNTNWNTLPVAVFTGAGNPLTAIGGYGMNYTNGVTLLNPTLHLPVTTRYVRVRCATFASGPVTANLVASAAPSPVVMTSPTMNRFNFSISGATSVTCDAAGMASVSVAFSSTNVSMSYVWECSNNNVDWWAFPLVDAATSAIYTGTINASTLRMYQGPLPARYFRLRIVSAAATLTGSIEFTSTPVTPIVVASAGTVDTELPAAVVLADAATNPTVPAVGAYNTVFNGSTWERARTSIGANGTAGVGIPAAGLMAYDGSTGFYRRLVADVNGYLAVQSRGASTIGSNRTTVTTAGTAAQFASTSVSSVTIKALTTNTGPVYIGSSVSAQASTGFEMAPGDTLTLEVSSSGLIWVNSVNNGDGVSYIYTGAA